MLWSALFFVLQGVALSHVIADLVPDATLDEDERAFFERNLAPFGLPSRVFRKLRDAADAETAVAPGTVLLREGEINYRLHFVLRGRVGIWRADKNGNPHQIGVVDAASDRGAIFGDVGYTFGERKDPTHYGEFALADLDKAKVTPSRVSIVVEPNQEEQDGGCARVLSWDKREFRALLRDLDKSHHNAETIVQGAFAVSAMEKMRRTQAETETTLHATRAEMAQLTEGEKRDAESERSLLRRPRSMLHGAYRAVFGGGGGGGVGRVNYSSRNLYFYQRPCSSRACCQIQSVIAYRTPSLGMTSCLSSCAKKTQTRPGCGKMSSFSPFLVLMRNAPPVGGS